MTAFEIYALFGSPLVAFAVLYLLYLNAKHGWDAPK